MQRFLSLVLLFLISESIALSQPSAPAGFTLEKLAEVYLLRSELSLTG